MNKRRTGSLALISGLMATAGLLAASPQAATVKAHAAKAVMAGPAAVGDARLRNPMGDPNNWVGPGRTYAEQHYSPLDQINTDTVAKLGLAWYADLPTDRGLESTPLAIDGVLYNTTTWNITTAYDGKTGKPLWTYDPKVDRDTAKWACCDVVTRGIAAWNGKIYIAALDGRLIAVDAKDGKPVWSMQTLEPQWASTVTGAPRVFDGVVVIGNAGGESASRGYVTGYDAETGKQLWRFYVTPGDPKKGFESKALAMAAKTWEGNWWETGGGGGNDWDTIVYDPKTKLVYIGTGNAGPWVQKYRAGGDNLFTSSIVAMNVKTGAYAWHFQEVPGDEWDFDATEPLMLADLKVKGQTRRVIMHAPKDGYFYVLDAASGKLISAKDYVPITWATGLDKNGKATVNPAARYGEKPTLVTPANAGSHNWNPMAYSPQTGLVYFPAMENYFVYSSDPNFKHTPTAMHQLGLSQTTYPEERKKLQDYAQAHTKSWLEAWDPVKQKEAWRVPFPVRGSAGVLATGGNLVFEGTMGETMVAYRADNGQKVWEMPVQQVPVAGAISYAIDGVQYVAINAGYGGVAHGAVGNDSGLRLSPNGRLLVFKLGGEAKLPVLTTAAKELTPPPPVTGSPAMLAKGAELYASSCSTCHGDLARGGVKDLRMMSPDTHAAFQAIVTGGARKDKGMPNFGARLSTDDAEAIHQYLIQRATEDWNDIKAGK